MDFGLDGYFSNWDADSYQPNISITGDILPSFGETVGNVWQPDFSDWYSQLYGQPQADGGGDWLSRIGSALKGAFAPVDDGKGGKKANPVGSGLSALLGGAMGAAGSQSQTLTKTQEPWAPLQPYLLGIVGDAQAMQNNFRQHPFTPQQEQAYSNAYSGLDQARSALPGLLSFGQQAMQRQSTTPSYQDLFGGGLLSPKPQARPTMQAGGPGGLLMDPRLYR